MEELEHALKKYNMGDAKTIKEIIAEVDIDNVCCLFSSFSSFYTNSLFYNSTWKSRDTFSPFIIYLLEYVILHRSQVAFCSRDCSS